MVAADVMENMVMEVTNRIQADNIDNIAILFLLQINKIKVLVDTQKIVDQTSCVVSGKIYLNKMKWKPSIWIFPKS